MAEHLLQKVLGDGKGHLGCRFHLWLLVEPDRANEEVRKAHQIQGTWKDAMACS